MAVPTKKVLHAVVHELAPSYETFTEKHGHRVEADIAFADVRPETYDGAFIPGGPQLHHRPGLN